MKISSPRIPKKLQENEDLSNLVAELTEDIEGRLFTAQTAHEISKSLLDVQTCIFNQCIFRECDLHKSRFCDVEFRSCDLSNVKLHECAFNRVSFVDCKLMGTNFSEGTFNHVSFSHCSAPYVIFSGSKFHHASFSESDMRRCAAENCAYGFTEFNQCNFTEAEFHQSKLRDIDLSTCGINGIRLTGNELRGAVVNSMQAVELAKLLGVIVV